MKYIQVFACLVCFYIVSCVNDSNYKETKAVDLINDVEQRRKKHEEDLSIYKIVAYSPPIQLKLCNKYFIIDSDSFDYSLFNEKFSFFYEERLKMPIVNSNSFGQEAVNCVTGELCQSKNIKEEVYKEKILFIEDSILEKRKRYCKEVFQMNLEELEYLVQDVSSQEYLDFSGRYNQLDLLFPYFERASSLESWCD